MSVSEIIYDLIKFYKKFEKKIQVCIYVSDILVQCIAYAFKSIKIT